MTKQFDVAVVGAGIVGLAHALAAAKRGLSVALFDRSPMAQGATVRNFGMIWPIGQTAGANHETAMRSRSAWLELGAADVLPVAECGSIHLAHRKDELAVLEEFVSQQSHEVRMLTAKQVVERSPLANEQSLLGGMWSASELRVDPRTAPKKIAAWLASKYDVTTHFATPIVGFDDGLLSSADGQSWRASRTIVCSGSDFLTLFPSAFIDSGLRRCKLQMLSCRSESRDPHEPHLASGLTLRHYTAFQSCPSLQTLVDRIESETPELNRYGIHVMASPFANGRVVLGDSHEYDEDIAPFDKEEIEALMLRELKSLIHLDNWNVEERWSGIYAKHPTKLVFEAEPVTGAKVFVGPGGAGMTLSFGLAEQAWQRWENETVH